MGRIELVLEQRARTEEQRLRLRDTVAQHLHQSRGARERVPELPIDLGARHRPSRTPSIARFGQRLLNRQIEQVDCRLDAAANRHERAAVLDEGRELLPSRLADAVRPGKFLVITRGIEAEHDAPLLSPDGNTIVSYFAERSPSKSCAETTRKLKPYCSKSHISQPPGMLLAPR